MATDKILGSQYGASWDDPANWSLGVLPQAADAVVVGDPKYVYQGQSVYYGGDGVAYVVSSLLVQSLSGEYLTLNVEGNLTVSGGTVLDNADLTVTSGGAAHLPTLTFAASIYGNAPSGITNTGGTLILGQVYEADYSSSIGTIDVSGGYTYAASVNQQVEVDIFSGTFAVGGVDDSRFSISGGLLVLNPTGATVDNQILDHGTNVQIDLATVPYQQGDTAQLKVVSSSPGHTQQSLTVVTAGGSSVFELTDLVEIAGPLQSASVMSDGAGGTLLTLLACYAAETQITVPGGTSRAGDLRIGDMVMTASREAKPIKWIGRRSYVGRFLAAEPGVMPIRFTAGCLRTGVPRRDLLVSPDHAMFLDRVLIPARCLVNGTTIRQERALPRIDYVHIELDEHDIILAEDAPSETFVDDDSRAAFHNAAEYHRLYPALTYQPALYCAPRCESGPLLESVRRRLAELAATIDRTESAVRRQRAARKAGVAIKVPAAPRKPRRIAAIPGRGRGSSRPDQDGGGVSQGV